MAFADQAALCRDQAFLDKIAVAVTKAAVDVLGEEIGGEGQPTAAEHTKRAALATLVLQAPPAWAQRIVWGVVSLGTLTDKSIDSDIQWSVNSLWDDYAGVDGTEAAG